MNLEQQVSVTVEPRTAHGNPAAIDGAVVFTVSHTDLVTVVQTSDVSATLVGVMTASVPPEGVSVLVTAEFDADLGEGVTSIVSSGALLVTSPQATTAEIIFGEPVDQ